MQLNKIDKIFLEDPKRMEMGKGKLASRYSVSEDEIEQSRKRVQNILSAAQLIEELESTNFNGSIKDTAKLIADGKVSSPADFHIDILKRQAASKIKNEQDKYKQVLSAYEELNDKYNDALQLKECKPVTFLPLIPGIPRQGASIIAISDWHVGKVIEKNNVNGFNCFNPEIAKDRVARFTSSTIKLINRDSGEFDKHDTLIYLLGDFIEGYIRPESQTIINAMTPIEEVAYAQELLSDSLATILENAKTDRITVVCRTGNHSRNSRRMESSIDHRTNYETMLYAFLAQKFKGDIEFTLPQGDIGYTEVLGKTIRDFHGWQVSYGGGIGGVTVPLTKFIQRQDANRRADYNLLGRYHQLSLPTKGSMLNGSLCGFDSYAQSIGASKEPALQGYRLLDSKYGFTGFNPIICE